MKKPGNRLSYLGLGQQSLKLFGPILQFNSFIKLLVVIEVFVYRSCSLYLPHVNSKNISGKRVCIFK